MHILEYYQHPDTRKELEELLSLGAQQHPDGLPDFFLEKDLWVTEILRLLYDEKLLGEFAVAFKGGTALSKCWKAIDRFSEDIDLSIHWADLAGIDDEAAAWQRTTRNPSQQKKFRQHQTDRLTDWSQELVQRLNQRLAAYNIEGLGASLLPDSGGEKIEVHFPRVTPSDSHYHLDYVLLEFGGRNRGQPTVVHTVDCYLSEVNVLSSLTFPQAKVHAYHPSFILWEKLTALHQFSTMEKEPNTHRLARHWYDVDCMLQKSVANPFTSGDARDAVIEMKKQRWAEKGVDYELARTGSLRLIPGAIRLAGIAKDHEDAIQGRMFLQRPDNFQAIIERISRVQDAINEL